MYKIASRYFMYSLGILAVRKALKNEKEKSSQNIPSFRGVLEVKSSIKGRIRFNIPSIKNQDDMSSQLKVQLERIASIKNVEINTITGSLLINYKPDIQPTLIAGIIIKLLGLEEKVKDGTESLVTKEVKNINESLSLAIDEKTKGLLDFKSLMFIALSAVGITKMIKYPDLTPPGFNYLWWGYTAINL